MQIWLMERPGIRRTRFCSLKEVLRAFLDHRRDVLLRRSRHRMEKIDHRLEVLEGFIIAFLNLDRVIEIIRTEDEPKPVMMAEFGLTDRQTEAILNMRLRSLRKLEEIALRSERERLAEEQADLRALLADEARQWTDKRDKLNQQTKDLRAELFELKNKRDKLNEKVKELKQRREQARTEMRKKIEEKILRIKTISN